MTTRFYNILVFKPIRRKLRREMTKSEWVLWSTLRNRKLGYKFRRQYSIGRYIVDFYCREARLIIEVDGISHDGSKYEYDMARQNFLIQKGFTVSRYSAEDVFNNLEGVIESINLLCKKSNTPPPR